MTRSSSSTENYLVTGAEVIALDRIILAVVMLLLMHGYPHQKVAEDMRKSKVKKRGIERDGIDDYLWILMCLHVCDGIHLGMSSWT